MHPIDSSESHPEVIKHDAATQICFCLHGGFPPKKCTAMGKWSCMTIKGQLRNVQISGNPLVGAYV
jgi:hypothetical protein